MDFSGTSIISDTFIISLEVNILVCYDISESE